MLCKCGSVTQQPGVGVKRTFLGSTVDLTAAVALTTVLPPFPVVHQGKYAEADPLCLRAIEIGERTLGPDHPNFAVWLGNRTSLLKKQVRGHGNVLLHSNVSMEVGVLAVPVRVRFW